MLLAVQSLPVTICQSMMVCNLEGLDLQKGENRKQIIDLRPQAAADSKVLLCDQHLCTRYTQHGEMEHT